MENNIKTTHIKYNGFCYFLLAEKIAIPVLIIWIMFLFWLAYLADKYGGVEVQEEPSTVLYLFISLATFMAVTFISIYYLMPGYFRGKFLRKEGYCIITPNYIEVVFGGKQKRYTYKNRSIKTKKYKDGSTDIFIGKSFMDFLKHGSILFTPAYFRAWKALMGFGAPLYRVINADEVLDYLKKHN
ncbi:MAG: hypothetical protein KTR20_12345 [Cellvibrionaceae bacterium]|nr:hypothetical protein [Cellvibrionaceae bacterium]